MKFVSETSLFLKSGAGGDGIIAWRRESRTPKGGPAGGDGGDGGSIFFVADINSDSLYHLRHKPFLQAENGGTGKHKMQNGRNGEDLYIKVPLGTNVYLKEKKEKLGELLHDKQVLLVCRGGKGGKGNAYFKSSNNPTPYMYERGDLSVEMEVFLELESISDIGFLGMPNAGKSTLLSVISNARPKIAPFPFTTLIPVLGAVVFKDEKLIFSDIPGLIENASQGQGLGVEFLKHLNRCRVLVHLVDISSESFVGDMECIIKELKKYSESLFLKPRLLCLNKIDLLDEREVKKREEMIRKKFNGEIISISAEKKSNITFFLERVFSFFQENKPVEEEKVDYLEIGDDPMLFAEIFIEKVDDYWKVEHPFLKYWTYKIPADTHDNRLRLLKKIESMELRNKLFKMGAKEGEEVNVYDFYFIL